MAEVAGLSDDIKSFPKEYDTLVGERGVSVSGGQRQRISIARALATNAPFLVLDDAFSAIDTRTEESILNHLKPLLLGHTVIIISHRVSSIQWMEPDTGDGGRAGGGERDPCGIDGVGWDLCRRGPGARRWRRKLDEAGER